MINFIKNTKTKIGLYAFALLGLAGSYANSVYAQASTTPEGVVNAVVGSGINSAVSMVTMVVTTFFPYLIAFAVIGFIFVRIKGFMSTGAK